MTRAPKANPEGSARNDDSLQRRLEVAAKHPVKVGAARLKMPHSPLTPDIEEPVEEGVVPVRPAHHVAADRFSEGAHASQRYFAELADRIERGDPSLTRMDGIFAAQAIRAYASQITLEMPRNRGADPKMDPGALAMEFALLHLKGGMTKNGAHETLAERHDVSITAVKKALKKYGDSAIDVVRAAMQTKLKKPTK